MFDGKVHQECLKQIEDHVKGKEDAEEDVDVRLVVVAPETVHDHYPDDPVCQRQQVYQVLGASRQVYNDGSADVPHYDAEDVGRNGQQYCHQRLSLVQVEVHQRQECYAVLEVDDEQAQFDESSRALCVRDIVDREKVLVVDVENLFASFLGRGARVSAFFFD